jgi:hypothetical protein
MINATAPHFSKSVPANLRKLIEHWDDERSMGNSLIVTLKPGKKFTIDEADFCHVEGFDTIKDAIAEVRRAVDCNCTQCSGPAK